MIFLFLSWIDFSIPVSNWGKHIMSLLSSKETRVNSISKGFFQTWKGGMWTMGRGKCWRLLVKKRSKSPVRTYWSQWQLSQRFKRQNKEQCHKWSTYIKCSCCCWLHQSDAKVVGNNSIISEKPKNVNFHNAMSVTLFQAMTSNLLVTNLPSLPFRRRLVQSEPNIEDLENTFWKLPSYSKWF